MCVLEKITSHSPKPQNIRTVNDISKQYFAFLSFTIVSALRLFRVSDLLPNINFIGLKWKFLVLDLHLYVPSTGPTKFWTLQGCCQSQFPKYVPLTLFVFQFSFVCSIGKVGLSSLIRQSWVQVKVVSFNPFVTSALWIRSRWDLNKFYKDNILVQKKGI